MWAKPARSAHYPAQPAYLESARQNEVMATESRALLIVDVQPTFCEGGALGVEGGTAVAEAVAEYVAQNRDFYTLIATTQDWHIEPGEHFATPPDRKSTRLNSSHVAI